MRTGLPHLLPGPDQQTAEVPLRIVKDIILAPLFGKEFPNSFCSLTDETISCLGRSGVTEGNHIMEIILCKLMVQKWKNDLYVYFRQRYQFFFEL